MAASPVALRIDVEQANSPRTPPPALEKRLRGTPKSPEDVSKALEINTERSTKLRHAHLEAIRDRGARETQRAQETIARKLRIAAARAEKLQRKIDSASSHHEAKKEATVAELAARRLHREMLALAVAEARKAAANSRAYRQAELLAAENAASVKHAKAVDEVVAKGKNAVLHALAVAQAHKDKTALEAAERGMALTERLHAAQARRELAATPPQSPDRLSKPLFRVKNDFKVKTAMRKIEFEVSMTKHEEARAAHLASITNKARAECDKVAAVAAKAKASAEGTDAATAEAKSAMYERMVSAEVARLQALKAKYAKHAGRKFDSPGLIIVCLDDVLKPRPPPAALVERLALKQTRLVGTAATRQEGAAARRRAAKQTILLKAEASKARQAAVAARIGKAHEAKAAAVRTKATRVAVACALTKSKRVHVAALSRARVVSAQLKRQQLAESMQHVGQNMLAKATAVKERKAKAMLAKTEGIATRKAVFRSRREALDAARCTRGAAAAARCTAAVARRAGVLEKRVATARKCAMRKSS